MLLFSDRFTTPAWQFAGKIPGGYPLIGGVLLTFGVLMVVAMVLNRPHHTARRDGLIIGGMTFVGLWWALLGAMFLYTACVDRTANPMGVVVWWLVASIYWTWSHFESRRL